MERIPFGIRQLDTLIGGGAPPGSVVLLSGEAGAGAREFGFTSAVMNGLANGDPELHDLYYGDVGSGVRLPDEVHYISFAADERQLGREIALTMDEEVVEPGIDAVTFHDLSREFFRLSPVPREWYADRSASVRELGAADRTTVPDRLGDLLDEHAHRNLVVIDSLTDLVGAAGEDLSWNDVPLLLKGLAKAAFDWEGLVLLHANREGLSPERHGQLVDAADGTMAFAWESGGSSRARVMVVKQFRGVLSRIEDEEIVRFETEIGGTGFDISNVQKIR